MTATPEATSIDYADVYRDQVDAVWRFVRSRVPTHHDAHDVTADVFVRAWRAWDRFDPARGAVEPWLFTIARRTVADWWRKQQRTGPNRSGRLEVAEPAAIEDGLVRAELLGGLAVALAGLSQRERDALALRFAAQLSMRHIGHRHPHPVRSRPRTPRHRLGADRRGHHLHTVRHGRHRATRGRRGDQPHRHPPLADQPSQPPPTRSHPKLRPHREAHHRNASVLERNSCRRTLPARNGNYRAAL